jgi:hypothetical protein
VPEFATGAGDRRHPSGAPTVPSNRAAQRGDNEIYRARVLKVRIHFPPAVSQQNFRFLSTRRLFCRTPAARSSSTAPIRGCGRSPVKSKGPDAINRQLDTFKAAIALSGSTVEEAFVAVLAPGWLDHFIFNEYYKTEEEFLFALADALREEYPAVVAAGFVLQIDDPGLPDWWAVLFGGSARAI